LFKSKIAKSEYAIPPADEAHSEKSVDAEPLNTRTNYRPELVNADYWHPKASNFEIIDWEKYETKCGSFFEDLVYDPPQRAKTPSINLVNDDMTWWQRSQINFPQTWATSVKPNIGVVDDDSLNLFAALLGPNPDSSLVPEPFRNNLLWMQDNEAPELLVSFNRGAWRANTPEGRSIGVTWMREDWSTPPNAWGYTIANYLATSAINWQTSPDGKFIKFARMAGDPSDPDIEVHWTDMYIIQEGDEFKDSHGNVMTDVEPGDIVRYTFDTHDAYSCSPEDYKFQYLPRKVAVLNEETGKITPYSPHYERLLGTIAAQPPAELHLQTLGFTNATTMYMPERWDFYVKHLSRYQLYTSAPTPPHADLLEFDGKGKCGDGIIQDPEECDDGNTEDGDGCSADCEVEQSCDIQLFNLQYPTEERDAANYAYYNEDMYFMRGRDLPFFLERKEECGSGGANFATLGKLVIGEYSDVARLLKAPQHRGFHLGRGKLVPERLPQDFMLSLDDPGTGTEQGESGIHQILHDFAWFDTIGKAQARIDSDEPTKVALESYITRLITEVAAAGDNAVAVKVATDRFTGRYMMKSLFNLDYSDQQVAGLEMLWQEPGLAVAALFEGLVSDEDWVGIKQILDSNIADIMGSSALADYIPSEDNFFMTKENWASNLAYVVGIAALGGGATKVNRVFTEIPSDYKIDLTNHEEVANAVLEAGRIQAAVNGVNLILQEPTDFKIGGEMKTFPEGTVVLVALILGSLDEKVFPDPFTYDHTRGNLLSNIVNFNDVGFDPEAVGTRVCPGRNIAMKMATDVLRAWRQRE